MSVRPQSQEAVVGRGRGKEGVLLGDHARLLVVGGARLAQHQAARRGGGGGEGGSGGQSSVLVRGTAAHFEQRIHSSPVKEDLIKVKWQSRTDWTHDPVVEDRVVCGLDDCGGGGVRMREGD